MFTSVLCYLPSESDDEYNQNFGPHGDPPIAMVETTPRVTESPIHTPRYGRRAVPTTSGTSLQTQPGSSSQRAEVAARDDDSSSYTTSTSSSSRSSSSSNANGNNAKPLVLTPRAPAAPLKRNDVFFDQRVDSKDYTSVIDSLSQVRNKV